MYESWIKAGIFKVEQLVIGNCFKSCQELRNEFGKDVNILDHQNIVDAMPSQWKEIIKNMVSAESRKSAEELLSNNLKCTSIAYKHLIQGVNVNDKNRIKWEHELQAIMVEERWSKLYEYTRQVTLSTKLRIFQYRIINRYLVTNKLVAIWDSMVKKECTFCEQEEESIIHLIYSCKYVQKLWKTLQRWLKHFCALDIELDNVKVTFNIYRGVNEMLINTLILITKYYIYVQRCYKKKLNFQELTKTLEKYKNIELNAARLLNKTKKIKDKWCIYDKI